MPTVRTNPYFMVPLSAAAPPPLRTSPDSLVSRFPIAIVSIIGILATGILLLSYYAFVTKCCLRRQQFNTITRLHQSFQRRHEDLFALHSNTAGVQGLEEWAIQGIPMFRYRKGQVQVSSNECAVCLNDFEEEERVRLLPDCLHVFHIDCIDAWLQTHANCPLCRLEITTRPQTAIDSVTELNSNHIESMVRHGEARISDCDDNAAGERWPEGRTARKLQHVSSMRDECVDRGSKGEEFGVQLMRRSFSMDSSNDRQLYIAVQQIQQSNPDSQMASSDEGSTSTETHCKVKRSFFFFGHSCSSKNAVLPIQNEV